MSVCYSDTFECGFDRFTFATCNGTEAGRAGVSYFGGVSIFLLVLRLFWS